MLTGSDLLAKVKDLGDVSKSDLVRSCGYVSTKKDGGERLNFTAFYEALLEAKGLSLGNDDAGRGKQATAREGLDACQQAAAEPLQIHEPPDKCRSANSTNTFTHVRAQKAIKDSYCRQSQRLALLPSKQPDVQFWLEPGQTHATAEPNSAQ